jgi:OPA family glycerol-3-phosphate transporter-like MFS transporter
MSGRESSLRRWQAVTTALMVVGYSGYYVCRSTLSVNLPLIAAELTRAGLPADVARVRLGTVVSFGVLAYALGKFVSGGLTDLIGGRRSFLAGMAGSVSFSFLFAAGQGLPIFTLAWIGNRLVQSAGWVGMVKLTSRWFPFAAYGSVMGIVSLSYLFGDAAARGFMAWLLALGFGWRAVFCIAAATLAVIFLITLLILRESPHDVGLEEPDANPNNLFQQAADANDGVGSIVLPLLRSPAFWCVCLLSIGVTLVRETFNTWTPTYFTEALRFSQAEAASRSAWFPFFGGVSVLLAGYSSDRLGRRGRAWIMVSGLFLSTLMLWMLATFATGEVRGLAVGLVAAIGFVLLGPYSYLAGAISLDFGGKRGGATAAGIIDGVGYLGGVLAGDGVARATVVFGWSGAFFMLAAVAALSTVFALLFLLLEPRMLRSASERPHQV